MSYCRWSSDDWKCDIYAYASFDGSYSINVASRKRAGYIPELPDIKDVGPVKWINAYKDQMEALAQCELVPIGLSHDGETFEEPTLEAAIERMKELKKEGYRVPDLAIKSMEEERDNLLGG